MKFKFNKMTIEVERSGYGQYKVKGIYSRRVISAHSTASNMFDKLDSEHPSEVRDAQRFFYNLLKQL